MCFGSWDVTVCHGISCAYNTLYIYILYIYIYYIFIDIFVVRNGPSWDHPRCWVCSWCWAISKKVKQTFSGIRNCWISWGKIAGWRSYVSKSWQLRWGCWRRADVAKENITTWGLLLEFLDICYVIEYCHIHSYIHTYIHTYKHTDKYTDRQIYINT